MGSLKLSYLLLERFEPNIKIFLHLLFQLWDNMLLDVVVEVGSNFSRKAVGDGAHDEDGAGDSFFWGERMAQSPWEALLCCKGNSGKGSSEDTLAGGGPKINI